MKKYVLFLFFINVCFFVFSVDFFVSYYSVIRITDEKLYYRGIDDEDPSEEYDITWEKVNNIDYITFDYTGQFMDDYGRSPVSKGIKRYLILYGGEMDSDGFTDFVILYDNNNEYAYFHCSRGTSERLADQATAIRATSEYIEQNITYSASNLLNMRKLQPWVEASHGTGIGERISMEYDTVAGSLFQRDIPRWGIFGIVISNGFIDYNRPYLYEHNNRLKKIRVHFDDTNEFVDFDVEDTPQLQYFQFNENYKRYNKIQIEILDVYKGSRWNDTCVNMILPYGGIGYK